MSSQLTPAPEDEMATMSRPHGGAGAGSAAAEPKLLHLRLIYSEHLASSDARLDQCTPITPERPKWVVGRAPRTDADDELLLPIPFDRWSSRSHARLRLVRGKALAAVIIEDLGSRNGVFVDGRRIQGPVMATVGQVVRIGGSVFVLGQSQPKRQRELLARQPIPEGLSARSWRMIELWESVVSFAQSEFGVLIVGEVGTGKTRMARHIHQLSARGGGPFVPHNCSAIPLNLEEATLFGIKAGFIPGVKEGSGLLTRAAGGTLFLDELADMPLVAQSKLLDAFDPTEPSYLPLGASKRLVTRCRLISATNRPVFELAAQGVLRQDLLSRLIVGQLEMPSIRDRREDILPIFAASYGRPDAPPLPNAEVAEAVLLAHWPENARGIESLARRAQLGGSLTPQQVNEHANRGLQTAVPEVSMAPIDAPTPLLPASSLEARVKTAPLPALGRATAAPLGWPPTSRELLVLLSDHNWSVKDAAGTLGRRRETVARLLTQAFGRGGRVRVQMAWRIYRLSDRVPTAEQLDAVDALYQDGPVSPATQEARDRWRLNGTVLPSTP